MSSILAHTPSPDSHERNHISLLLVEKYPFLKGSFGAGHVCTMIFIIYVFVFKLVPIKFQLSKICFR